MKSIAAGSRLSLAFVLSAAITACASLMVQSVAAASATAESTPAARPGSMITRYPIKMREIRNMPSLDDQQAKK